MTYQNRFFSSLWSTKMLFLFGLFGTWASHNKKIKKSRWDTEAVITHIRDNGASYFVKTKQGRELLRGRRLIRPAPTATRAPVLNQARRLQAFSMSSSSSSSHARSSSASGGARGVSRRDRDPSWRRGSSAVPPLSVNLRDIRSAHHVCFGGGLSLIHI